MDARNLLSLSGVLLVLGAAGYYWGMGQSGQELVNGNEQSLPDYQVESLEGWQTDEQGRLLRHLKADSVTHYPKPEQALMQAPVVTLYKEGEPAWRVTARQGISLDQNSHVILKENVLGERLTPGVVPVKVSTSQLEVFPAKESLKTDAVVTINSPQGHIQSRGLSANLKENTLNLHSEVQGIYVKHP